MEAQAQHGSFSGIPSDPNMALTYDPHAGHGGEEAVAVQGPTDKPAIASGWVGAGFGLFQLLAPEAFGRLTGTPYPAWLIRAVGARDLLLGSGLLAKPESPGLRVAHLASDLLDTAMLGAAMFSSASNRRRIAGFAALSAAIIALDAYNAAQTAGSQTADETAKSADPSI